MPRKPNKSKLARLRVEAGLTQQQLADRIGTTQTQVRRWEAGEFRPSMEFLSSLARALECSVEQIIAATRDRAVSQEGR